MVETDAARQTTSVRYNRAPVALKEAKENPLGTKGYKSVNYRRVCNCHEDRDRRETSSNAGCRCAILLDSRSRPHVVGHPLLASGIVLVWFGAVRSLDVRTRIVHVGTRRSIVWIRINIWLSRPRRWHGLL